MYINIYLNIDVLAHTWHFTSCFFFPIQHYFAQPCPCFGIVYVYHFYVSSLKATQAEYRKKLEEVLTHFATLVSQGSRTHQTIRFTLLVSHSGLARSLWISVAWCGPSEVCHLLLSKRPPGPSVSLMLRLLSFWWLLLGQGFLIYALLTFGLDNSL